MHVRVLGSAAGGGFPQWNCRCENCLGMRQGHIQAQARTQSSLAVSANGSDWILVNASPDIRAQILQNDIFLPAEGLRGSTIKGIVLVDAQLDHTSGLLFLREGGPLSIYGTASVERDLTQGYPILNILQSYCGAAFHRVELKPGDNTFSVEGVDDLLLTAIPLPSKAPPYSPNRYNPTRGDNIALKVLDLRTKKCLVYAPGLGAYEDHLEAFFASSDCLLVDGTFWWEDEMMRRGVGTKTASAMGHLPLSGPAGMLEVLQCFPNSRKILIHINNTNPILNELSPQRHILNDKSIEVAYDGMDIIL